MVVMPAGAGCPRLRCVVYADARTSQRRRQRRPAAPGPYRWLPGHGPDDRGGRDRGRRRLAAPTATDADASAGAVGARDLGLRGIVGPPRRTFGNVESWRPRLA